MNLSLPWVVAMSLPTCVTRKINFLCHLVGLLNEAYIANKKVVLVFLSSKLSILNFPGFRLSSKHFKLSFSFTLIFGLMKCAFSKIENLL